MKHHDCITILLGRRGAHAPGDSERAAAEEHAARCSDCWTVLGLLHELATGQPAPDTERMAPLFGCGPVQEDLYLLAGLGAAQIRSDHPALARHLGWCAACRDRLAEVMVVERAAARGELPPVLAPAARWQVTRARVGQTIHAAVGRVVVKARRAAAAFTLVPEGFTVMPLATAGATRGLAAADAVLEEALGQELAVSLPESPLSAELSLEPHGDERVGVAVRVTGAAPAARLSIHLRLLGGARPTLVARHAVRGAEPVVFKALGAGQYVLEIHEQDRARRFHLRFDVETPA